MDLTTTLTAGDEESAAEILKGLRASFITKSQYTQMQQSENLADLQQHLKQTDYASYLKDCDELPLPYLRQIIRKKLADQFNHFSANTSGSFRKFIELIRHKYMIDNVVSIVEGIKNNIPKEHLLNNADPLGNFPQITQVAAFGKNYYTELYKEILMNSPVGPYFMRFIEQSIHGLPEIITVAEVQKLLKENETRKHKIFSQKGEIIKQIQINKWLEDFYKFSTSELPPTNLKTLENLLKFEADIRSISVIYNTIRCHDISPANIGYIRKLLSPSIGYLYPDLQAVLFSVTTLDDLKEVINEVENLQDILKDAPEPQKEQSLFAKTFDDLIFEEEIKLFSLSFNQACKYSIFYSYFKLKEQEVRNIVWIASMIASNFPQDSQVWKKIIVPFDHLESQSE